VADLTAREWSAYHEAGHAVACLLAGRSLRPFGTVVIGFEEFDRLWGNVYLDMSSVREFDTDAAVMYLSGAEAVHWLLNVPQNDAYTGASQDVGRVMSWLLTERQRLDWAAAQSEFAAIQQRTGTFVRNHADKIAAVAQALLEHGSLTFSQVVNLVFNGRIEKEEGESEEMSEVNVKKVRARWNPEPESQLGEVLERYERMEKKLEYDLSARANIRADFQPHREVLENLSPTSRLSAVADALAAEQAYERLMDTFTDLPVYRAILTRIGQEVSLITGDLVRAEEKLRRAEENLDIVSPKELRELREAYDYKLRRAVSAQSQAIHKAGAKASARIRAASPFRS